MRDDSERNGEKLREGMKNDRMKKMWKMKGGGFKGKSENELQTCNRKHSQMTKDRR